MIGKNTGKQSKYRGIKRETIECPHCNKTGGQPQMIQWHFDNCKQKELT
jgi:hypothetical protein